MSPLLSIIIPFYNSERTILDCVESVINQKIDKNKIEIILVNDASKDKSLKIIKENFKKKNIKIIKNFKNKGVSHSRNFGIKNSSGEYLIFLDSDDTLIKNSLKLVLRLIEQRSIDLIYFNKKLKKNSLFCPNDKMFTKINKLTNFTCHSWNFVINKNFLKKNKIYFKNIKIFEDQPFVTALLLKSNFAHLINKGIVKHYEQSNSLSRNTNFISAISCLNVLENIIKILPPKNLKKYIIIFLKKRLVFLENNLNLYSYILKKKHLISLNRKFLKLIKLQNKKIKICKIKNFIHIFELNNVFNKREKLFENLKKRITILSTNKTFIFSCGIYGRILALILRSLKFKIRGFLDNNKLMENKICVNLKVYNPNIIKNLALCERETMIVLVPHKNIKIQKEITNQLINFNIKKKNIFKINNL